MNHCEDGFGGNRRFILFCLNFRNFLISPKLLSGFAQLFYATVFHFRKKYLCLACLCVFFLQEVGRMVVRSVQRCLKTIFLVLCLVVTPHHVQITNLVLRYLVLRYEYQTQLAPCFLYTIVIANSVQCRALFPQMGDLPPIPHLEAVKSLVQLGVIF